MDGGRRAKKEGSRVWHGVWGVVGGGVARFEDGLRRDADRDQNNATTSERLSVDCDISSKSTRPRRTFSTTTISKAMEVTSFTFKTVRKKQDTIMSRKTLAISAICKYIQVAVAFAGRPPSVKRLGVLSCLQLVLSNVILRSLFGNHILGLCSLKRSTRCPLAC